MPDRYSFNDPQPSNPFQAWIGSPYVQQLLANTGIPFFGNEKSKLPTGYINDPGTDPSANIFTKGWFDGGGTWHPYASDFPTQRSISSRKTPSFIQSPATQAYGGSPFVPVDATEGNPNYSPFSSKYSPSQSSTQAYDPSGSPSPTLTNLPNLTFGSRYLQGTNYAAGDPNAPAGMGGRFWQTLAQNQEGWQPSPTAQDLMSKNVPQQLGNTINLTQTPMASQAIASNTNKAMAPVSKTKATPNISPLYQNQRASQPYLGSAAWSAIRGMR